MSTHIVANCTMGNDCDYEDQADNLLQLQALVLKLDLIR